MPPKQKFSKEDILKIAFQLVREQGIENLNARAIAKMLRSSTQPVFSYYENMADLKSDLFIMVSKYHSNYFNKVETGENLFLNIGMTYVDFAIEEPHLFRMLFMSNGFQGKGLSEFVTDDCNNHISNAIPGIFDRNAEESNRIFTDMWLYAHGIASMVVMNQLSVERKEIGSMIKNIFSLLTTEREVITNGK